MPVSYSSPTRWEKPAPRLWPFLKMPTWKAVCGAQEYGSFLEGVLRGERAIDPYRLVLRF